jgi:hypothetical protein
MTSRILALALPRYTWRNDDDGTRSIGSKWVAGKQFFHFRFSVSQLNYYNNQDEYELNCDSEIYRILSSETLQ